MENEHEFKTTTTVQPLVDTNAIVQEVVVGVLSGLALVAGLGFMVYMVGKAVLDDAKSSGKWEGRREAEEEAQVKLDAERDLHRSEVARERDRADRVERQLQSELESHG